MKGTARWQYKIGGSSKPVLRRHSVMSLTVLVNATPNRGFSFFLRLIRRPERLKKAAVSSALYSVNIKWVSVSFFIPTPPTEKISLFHLLQLPLPLWSFNLSPASQPAFFCHDVHHFRRIELPRLSVPSRIRYFFSSSYPFFFLTSFLFGLLPSV